MVQEDGDLEIFKVEEVMLLSKIKQLYSYLWINDRIGIQMRSNIPC